MSHPIPHDAGQVSDDDRISVAQLLAEAAANGRLSVPEYERRLVRAYAATSYGELERLGYDLPEALEFRRGPCRPAPSTVLLALLSGFERRGRWCVPGRLTTVTVFGGGMVDLRHADFTSPRVQINAYAILGRVTIVLPPEVNVEVRGVAVLGGLDRTVGPGAPGAPTVTVRGFSLGGGVSVRRRPRVPAEPPAPSGWA
ncbi:MAG: DUF1707 domain-containing protein [Mycobacterium sp.]|nr:DUF1707 domain-containing protein [Mycobacterium sp.]